MPRPRLAAALAVPLAALGLAACGSDQDAKLLERAAARDVSSGQMAVRVTATRGGKPLSTVSVSGPFRSNGRERLPSFDWTVSGAGPEGAKSARVVSTGRNVFITYRGRRYQVGERNLARLQRRHHARAGKAPRDLEGLRKLGVDPARWLVDPKSSDGGTLDGVGTTHLSARFDVKAALGDLAKLMRSPAFAGQGHRTLGPLELSLIEKSITNPVGDVWIGRDDAIARRATASADIQPPFGAGAAQKVHVAFRVDLTRVGRAQRIATPRGGRPIRQLVRRLGLRHGHERGGLHRSAERHRLGTPG